MAGGFSRYLSRKYYKKIEKRLDVRAILGCWALNFGAAGLVFVFSWLLFSSVIVTILYTLSSWTFTFVISVVYWLDWINRRHDVRKIRAALSSAMLVMLIAGMAVIIQTFLLIMRLTGV